MPTLKKRWTLAEVHRLPDDGNKYELVRGELFVTPPPNDSHETILARLTGLLAPYVEVQGLGYVFHPRAVVRYEDSEVEPDLMVRQPHPAPTKKDADWNTAPKPILIVEVHSDSTRRRDRVQKRSLYMDAGIAEYWMVDPDLRVITVVRSGREDVVFCHPERSEGSAPSAALNEDMTWAPAGVSAPLTFALTRVFGESLLE